MATPHNNASKGDIAKKVLMPGDPLRAKFIAENYFENIVQFNDVRNMYGYTGTYKGEKISVMGAGMGIPSIGIYSHELFDIYDVDEIIRIGSAGALQDDMKLGDLVIAMSASTDSNYAMQLGLPGTYAPTADFGLLRRAVTTAEKLGIGIKVGSVMSSDVFYDFDASSADKWKNMGICALEMEVAGLYINAAYSHKKALGLLTVSDIVSTGEGMSPEERQTGFANMMKIALEM